MQERAGRTRRAILRVAAEMFETRGYLGTSLQDIADRMDVSKGALYFHFRSKESLAIAFVEEQCDQWTDLIDRLREIHPRAIRLMIELSWQFAFSLRMSIQTRACIRLTLERNLIGPSIPHVLTYWTGVVEGLLEDARRQGDLLPKIGTREPAEFIVTAFAGLPHLLCPETERTKALRYVAILWRCVLPRVVTEKCLTEMKVIVSL